MKLIRIADGVDLCLLKSEKFKTNYFSINFINFLSRDTVAQNALIPLVLKRGCKPYPDLLSVNRRLDELYGAILNTSIRKMGENQVVSISLEFLDNAFTINNEDIYKECLDFVAAIVKEPVTENSAFKEDFVEQEKKNLIDIINSQINDKKNYAIIRCYEEMCRGEAFEINEHGNTDTVSKITSSELYAQYNNFINNSRIIVFFEGSCDEARLTDTVKAIFDGKREPAYGKTQVITKAEKVTECIEEIDVNQGKLSLGFRTGLTASDDDFVKLALFNVLYGGSPNGKLFENVRERLSLCYYCSSRLEKHKGLMIVYSGIENDKKDVAFKEIMAQLEEIKNGNIKETELDAAKKSLINLYLSSEDSVPMTEDFYIGQLLVDKNLSPKETAAKVSSITAQELSELAKQITLDTVYFLKGREEGEDK